MTLITFQTTLLVNLDGGSFAMYLLYFFRLMLKILCPFFLYIFRTKDKEMVEWNRLRYKKKVNTDHHHHLYHYVAPSARISLTLSHHPSLSSIASGRSSGLHPVLAQSCCMRVRPGRPAFAGPGEGVHRSTSLMSSPLLLQKCPACLFCLTLIVFVMGGRWPYSCCFVGSWPPGLLQYYSQHSCVVGVKLFSPYI